MLKKREGEENYGSEDRHRSEGKKGEGIGFCKTAQGIEIESSSVKRLYLGGDTSGIWMTLITIS